MKIDDYVFVAYSVNEGKWYVMSATNTSTLPMLGPYDTREDAEESMEISAHRLRRGWSI